MSAYSPSDHLRLLTANVLKGYTALKRRHAPQELREAVRALGSDLVFLHEACCSGVGQHARSFPARWPLLLLGRIYVRGVVAARPRPMARLPWSRLSDHEPLAAEIDLPGPP